MDPVSTVSTAEFEARDEGGEEGEEEEEEEDPGEEEVATD